MTKITFVSDYGFTPTLKFHAAIAMYNSYLLGHNTVS